MISLEIKILNSQTIKLTLTTKDMKKHNITHTLLKNNEKITKNLILKLLKEIKETITIDLTNNKMFLESFKTKEKGCILYLSVPTPIGKTIKQSKNKEIIAFVATFKTDKNLKRFCENISYLKNKKYKSELYIFDEKFFLITSINQNEEKEFFAIAKEFGQIYGKGSIKHSVIREHCKLIFKTDAIENIIKTY